MTMPEPQFEEKSPIGAGKPPLTVLVVDDEPLTCWSIAEVLSEHGFRVRKAADADSALQTFASADGPPDLVLLDMCLPDSNDLAVLSVVHRRFPRLPVVLMTAHGSPALSDEARRRGAVSVLNKPFEIDTLAMTVERLLANR
jgi:DNA-binding NtrC family response regulator